MTFTFNAGNVSVSEEIIDRSVKIAPNPSDDGMFNIEVNDSDIQSYTVHDIQGREIQNNLISQSVFSLDLSELQSGIYLISFINKSGIKSQDRIVIE